MLRTLHDQVNQLASADPDIVIAVAACVDLIASNKLPQRPKQEGGAR
jgi:hypothetical protein